MTLTSPNIYSFNNVSEAGMKDKTNSVMFVGGCNFRCSYCMNAKLVNAYKTKKIIPLEEIKSKCEANCTECLIISGGEPLMLGNKNITELCDAIHSWGIKVGLCTNGYIDEVLFHIVELVDFVALDLKTADGEVYAKISGEDADHVLYSIGQSAIYIRDRKDNDPLFEYEFRTTLYPPYVDIEDVDKIGKIFEIEKDEKWILQQFRHTPNMLNDDALGIQPYSQDEMRKMLEVALKYTQSASLRYM